MPLNTAVIDQWATRLESGKDRQIQSQLTDGRGGYCCLGVLCEMAVESGVIPPMVEEVEHYDGYESDCDCCDNMDPYDTHAYKYDGSELLPPPAVITWAFGEDNEVQSNNPVLKVGNGARPERDWVEDERTQYTASGLNDDWGWDFKQIAAAVRLTYLETGNDVTDSDGNNA